MRARALDRTQREHDVGDDEHGVERHHRQDAATQEDLPGDHAGERRDDGAQVPPAQPSPLRASESAMPMPRIEPTSAPTRPTT